MKKNYRIWIYSLVIIGAFLMFTNSCKKEDENNDPAQSGTVKDIDGNSYHTVTIGTQVWMVENLKTTKYRNGDPIPIVLNSEQLAILTTGAYCNVRYYRENENKYGYYYNWYSVIDSRNIAPNGWHVPTYAEWETLKNYVAANLGTSGSVAKALASTADWVESGKDDTVGADLTKNNTTGFTAYPSGYLVQNFANAAGFSVGFWSSTKDTEGSLLRHEDLSFIWGMSYNGSEFNPYGIYPKSGQCVRCIKD